MLYRCFVQKIFTVATSFFSYTQVFLCKLIAVTNIGSVRKELFNGEKG